MPPRRLFLYEYLSGGGLVAQGAEGLLAEGRAMRDALAEPIRRLPGWQLQVAATEPGDGQVVPQPHESPEAFVRRQALQHDAVWVIAPETEGWLARLRAAVPAGVGWVGCTAEAIALASHKRATVQALAAAGVPVPRAGLDHAGRWVRKPDDGAGSVATTVHAGAMPPAPPGWHHEPWVEGEAMSLSLLCAAGSVELLSVNRLPVQLAPDGRVEVDLPVPGVMSAADARWPVLAALAQAVARAVPGLRGFVGVDLVWHVDAGPVVIEVNPRVTSAIVGLSAALGRPVVPAILQSFVDDE